MDAMIGPRMSPVPVLDIYAHSSVLETIYNSNAYLGGYRSDGKNQNADLFAMAFHPLERGETVWMEQKDLRITAIVSHHATPGSCYNYVIQRGGKTLLYAADTGGYD